MSLIPLVEHERPRVMLLDFSESDAKKFRDAGFEAKRGATGVLPQDRNEFFFPFPVQEVEVVFAQAQSGSFAYTHSRQSNSSSEEAQPFFEDLVREVWARAGWLVFFVSQGCSAQDFASIGIDYLGVVTSQKSFEPGSLVHHYLQMNRAETTYEDYGSTPLPELEIPSFSGSSLILSDDAVENEVLKRFIRRSNKSVLACNSASALTYGHIPYIVVSREKRDIIPLAWDTSTSRSIVAFKNNISHFAGQQGKVSFYNYGRALFLPDFGPNNVNVALALMQEVIPLVSPHLFDAPQHGWLEKYQPATVLRLEQEKKDLLAKAEQESAVLDARANEEREKFGWLSGLLVSTGDQFASDAAEALRFLGFEVVDVDEQVAPGERKKEDLHIHDRTAGFFAIGEAKTTGKGRGAQEEFITKTQTHQHRYGREYNVPSPRALLLVNYAIDHEPKQRGGRFFKADLGERLEENQITAVDSVALWELCQAVLDEKMTADEARARMCSGAPFIRIGDL